MQHEHTEHIAAPPDAVYAAISDVANLPRVVPQLTGARQADGDRVEVEHAQRLPRLDAGRARQRWIAADALPQHAARVRERPLDAIRMLVEAEV